MKGEGADGLEHLKVLPAAEQGAPNAGWTAADADQTAADADQISAALDTADATSDQRASDEDQASADRQRADTGAHADAGALATYEATRLARKATTTHRLAAHAERAGTADLRIRTAAGRDATAAGRDDTARRRDLRAEEVGRAIAAYDALLAEKLEQLRARAAADRAKAALDRAGAARERALLEAELLGAHLDDLTGAYRREIGTLALTLEIDRARRADGRFILAFVDVDDLKLVNDRYGHAAGDRVLETLARTLRSSLRAFDPIVRYGGDEFVCGLGGSSLGEVERRFAAIDALLCDEVGVGISVGLADLSADETLDQLIARADAALLDAKKRRVDRSE